MLGLIVLGLCMASPAVATSEGQWETRRFSEWSGEKSSYFPNREGSGESSSHYPVVSQAADATRWENWRGPLPMANAESTLRIPQQFDMPLQPMRESNRDMVGNLQDFDFPQQQTFMMRDKQMSTDQQSFDFPSQSPELGPFQQSMNQMREGNNRLGQGSFDFSPQRGHNGQGANFPPQQELYQRSEHSNRFPMQQDFDVSNMAEINEKFVHEQLKKDQMEIYQLKNAQEELQQLKEADHELRELKKNSHDLSVAGPETVAGLNLGVDEISKQLSNDDIIRIAQGRGLKVSHLDEHFSVPGIGISLADISVGTNATAKQQDLMDIGTRLQQPSPCYNSPCVWQKTLGGYGQPSDYKVRTKDPATGEWQETTEAPVACEDGQTVRVWTPCNDGAMAVDGCQGYCALDPIGGYVSMVSAAKDGSSQGSMEQLVTKDTLDLVSAQLNLRWTAQVDLLTNRIAAAQSTIRDMQRRRDTDFDDDEDLGQGVERESADEVERSRGQIARANNIKAKVESLLQSVEVKQQRAMIAALHGHAGLCCCNFQTKHEDATPTCKWYSFKGDIDPQTLPEVRFQYQYGDHPFHGIGAVTQFGYQFGHGTTINCGNSEAGDPMITFAALFAAKDQFEAMTESQRKWDDDMQGPFFFQSQAALDQCAAGKNWKDYMARNAGMTQNVTEGRVQEFPGFEMDFDPAKGRRAGETKLTLANFMKTMTVPPYSRPGEVVKGDQIITDEAEVKAQERSFGVTSQDLKLWNIEDSEVQSTQASDQRFDDETRNIQAIEEGVENQVTSNEKASSGGEREEKGEPTVKTETPEDEVEREPKSVQQEEKGEKTDKTLTPEDELEQETVEGTVQAIPKSDKD